MVCEVVRSSKGLQAVRVCSMDNSTAIPPSQLPQRTHVVAPPESDWERVVVKWFSRLRGFGFLTHGPETPDIFVHMETLRRSGFTELRPGQTCLCATAGDQTVSSRQTSNPTMLWGHRLIDVHNARSLPRAYRGPVEASGITRRVVMCCNVSQLEADCQIAGHWLPSRNDPTLNREATRVALRQGSLRVGHRAPIRIHRGTSAAAEPGTSTRSRPPEPYRAPPWRQVGITRRWGMCCNVSQLEADSCQIAGHWLPSRNDPTLNREATRVALRQGSLRVGHRDDPHPPGDIRGAENGTPTRSRSKTTGGRSASAAQQSHLHQGKRSAAVTFAVRAHTPHQRKKYESWLVEEILTNVRRSTAGPSLNPT